MGIVKNGKVVWTEEDKKEFERLDRKIQRDFRDEQIRIKKEKR